MLQEVCCEFCRKKETDECPVKTASPWSRWADWCSRYEKNDEPAALTIQESVREYWRLAHPGNDNVIPDLGDLLSWLMKETEKFQSKLFKLGAMEHAPCFVCGYNGPGYFDPVKHPCANKHHFYFHNDPTIPMPKERE